MWYYDTVLFAVHPSCEQVRYYALAALNGFDDLEDADAIANARSELDALVRYLDRLTPTDHAVPIFGLRVIDGSARLERLGRDVQLNDPADLEVMRR